MYEAIKELLLELFRAPSGPPHPPAGTHDSVQIFRASSQFLKYQIIMVCGVSILISIILFIIGIFVIVENPTVGMILTIGFLMLGMLWIGSAYFLVRLEYDMRYYVVTDRSLRIRKGVWNIIEQTLTFANIQNIKIEQGPIERLLGFSNLVAETAGGGSAVTVEGSQVGKNYHKAVLNGLDNAAEVRDLIMGYLRKIPQASGLGDPDERRGTGLSQHPAKTGFNRRDIEVLREILTEVKDLHSAI